MKRIRNCTFSITNNSITPKEVSLFFILYVFSYHCEVVLSYFLLKFHFGISPRKNCRFKIYYLYV